MEEYYNVKDFMSSIDKDRKFLEDIVFEKIKKSISENTDRVCLFNIISDGEDEVTSFYLNRKEYKFFLESYLKSCETREDYETCSKVIEIKGLL